MTRKWFGPTLRMGVLLAVCIAVAAPAYAQLGSLKGRVVDEAGNPVPDADLTLEYAGEMNYRYTGKTDQNGEWIRAGLYSAGRWTITAKKGNMAGFVSNVEVPTGTVGEAPEIVVRTGGALPSAGGGMSQAEAEAAQRQQAELKKLFDEVNAALVSNSYAEAVTKLTEATTMVEGCAVCYTRLGDVHVKQGDFAQAETAYQKSIELAPNSPDGYEGLAVLYNSQRKFAEAAEASAKAAEVRGASGGGGDATSLFNSGAIFMNQGKMEEAQAAFQQAVAADPTMAEAHYQLAMTFINQGKVAEAVKTLEQYLSLNPTGPNAQTAKDMLPELQKMQ